MVRQHDRKIILEDGSVYTGYGFGASCDKVNEIVFNTSMVGYQEIVSDPSYTDQMVVMTYPLIGNYGITDEDFETRTPTIGGLIVREYNDLPSNFRYTRTLSEILEENDIPGIADVDTRELTRSIRDLGSRKVLITDIDTPVEQGLEILRSTALPTDAVSRVSCKKRWYSKTFKPKYSVVAIDCGIKLNIVRSLNRRGCNVTVVPWNTPIEVIEEMHPDGVFFSNGPGDPENVPEVVELIRALRGRYPIFGICLGHQLISLAYGAKTYKLKFGHRGGNHPVKDLRTGKIEITSQNHSYAVDQASIAGTDLEVTHINLLDNTVEGVSCERDSIFSVQYHPESAPGPQDSAYLFDRFISKMEEWKHAKKNRYEKDSRNRLRPDRHRTGRRV
ncbi:MAG: glutamine-hydrolyzing carbamoyl-phosphate synthase small subunit [Christensenellaceae bacterium]